MSTFEVAHIREQGQDMIIVPLKSSFGFKRPQQKNLIKAQLQRCASLAGLAGEVVPVWEEHGRLASWCPDAWGLFFESISLDFVYANING